MKLLLVVLITTLLYSHSSNSKQLESPIEDEYRSITPHL